MSFAHRFRLGFNSLQRGLGSLKQHPELKKYLILPIVIDILVVLAVFFGLFSQLAGWINWAVGLLISPESALFGWLYYPMWVIAGIALVVICLYMGFVLATIFAAPFNSLLAEKTLDLKGVDRPLGSGLAGMVMYTLRMLWLGLVKGIIFRLVAIILAILSLIPVVNILATIGVLLIMSFDTLDYSFEALGMNLRQRFLFAEKHVPELLGIATILGLTLVLPGLTLILLPIMIIGAGDIFSEAKSQGELDVYTR